MARPYKPKMNLSPNHDPEFKIGDVVTLDLYNHKDDTERVEVIDYDTSFGGELLYVVNVDGRIVQTTGRCIMESKDYSPVPDDERHPKKRVKGIIRVDGSRKISQ